MKFIRMGGAGWPCAQERDGRGRCSQRPASAPGSHDAARYHSDPFERCRVFPRPEEILVLHLHGERRGRRPAARPERSAGPGSPTRSIGSIERTGLADIGRHRSCRSATRLRLSTTWISRRPPVRLVRRAQRRNAGERLLAPRRLPASETETDRAAPGALSLRCCRRQTSACLPFAPADRR
jgi:hypothetical protein